MKKLFVIIFALLSCVFVQASERVIFTYQGVHDKPLGRPTPKSPIQPPTVYIEDYVLTFTAGHPDFVLNIKDEDGYVVYTTTVWSADTEVVLPSSLSGDYGIELVMGSWLFTGWIEL